jgi:hypothetical protein
MDTRINNQKRHDRLNALIRSKGSAIPILCVPARMTSRETKGIENKWPEVHFILANACPRDDSNTHPSVVRIMGRNTVMFPKDQSTAAEKPDALILEQFEIE